MHVNLQTILKRIILFASNVEHTYNTRILFSDNTSTFVWMLLTIIPVGIMFGLILSYRKLKELKTKTVNNYIPMDGESMNCGTHLSASSTDRQIQPIPNVGIKA